METIGQRVRTLREQHGYSQAALGSLIGVEQSQISNIENGYGEPSLKTLRRLARVFEVSLDELDVEPTTTA